MSGSIEGAPQPPAASRRAARLVFLATGLCYAAWAPLVPLVRDKSGLGDSGLGLLLLCVGLGSIAAMPFAGALARRCGHRLVLAGAALLASVVLPLLAILSGRAALVAALAVFGAGIGSLDVVMNLEAIAVERREGRPLMSGFHALFSIGGIVGAGGVALLLHAGLSPPRSAGCASLAVLLLLAAAWPGLSRCGGGAGGAILAVPRGVVLLIGALCAVLFLVEGAVLDWSGVLLAAVRHRDAAFAGFGYAAFAAAMTVGRLGGDRIVAGLGQRRVVGLGAACAACGFALAALVPNAVLDLAGYALVGIGCANIVPVLFSAAGRQRAMPESIAVPAIATLGYAGMVCGPAVVGVVAGMIGLPGAFALLAALLLVVAAAGRLV